MAETTPAERMAYARQVQAHKREAAKETARMPDLMFNEEPPILVQAGDALTPSPLTAPPSSPPMSSTAPALPPAPPPPPAWTPLQTVRQAERLDPDQLGTVTVFSEHWLQTPTYEEQYHACTSDAQRYKLWSDALREARYTLPLLQIQYREACNGPDGPTSQQALKVKDNLQWAEALLAQAPAQE